MDILIISHMFPTEYQPNYGIFVLQQAKALKALGHNVIVVSPHPWIPKFLTLSTPRWKQIANSPDEDIIEGIKVVYKKSLVPPKVGARFRGLLYYLQHSNFFKDLTTKKNIDLILAHSLLIDGYLAIKLKQKLNIPAIITVHGSDLTVLLKKKKDKRRLLQVAGAADRIVLVSNRLKELLAPLVHSEARKKLVLIYNGIEPVTTPEEPEWFGQQKAFKIVSIGSLTKQKNYSQVMLALKKLKQNHSNIKYFIIGEGWHRSFYENEITKLKLDKDVFLLGNLPHDQAMGYLKNADLFVLTSKDEGFGIVYLEAMYFNRIVIGSRGEAIEEIVTNGVNGYLVHPEQANELARQIDYVIAHYNELDELRRNAHETVWPAFSWENNAKKYDKLFQQIFYSENKS